MVPSTLKTELKQLEPVHRLTLIICMLVGLTFGGCGRKETPAASTAPAEAKPAVSLADSLPAEGSAPPGPGGETGKKEEDVAGKTGGVSEGATPESFDPAIGNLQSVVDSYYSETKQKPASIDELVRKHYLPVAPTAPAGKKYIIDQKTMTVKSVPK